MITVLTKPRLKVAVQDAVERAPILKPNTLKPKALVLYGDGKEMARGLIAALRE